jgi:hypothetical protein
VVVSFSVSLAPAAPAAAAVLTPALLAGQSAFLRAFAEGVRSTLALPASAGSVSVSKIVDLATGDVWTAPARAQRRRGLAGAAGSKGVAISVEIGVGKTPALQLLQNLTAAIASPAGAAAIAGSAASSVAAATGQPASAFASSVSAPAVANSLFVVPASASAAPVAASGGGGSSSGASASSAAAVGGAVGGVAVVALIGAVAWYFVAKAQSSRAVVARMREADERQREADAMIATVTALNPVGAAKNAGAAGMVVRNIVRENAELKAKLAAAERPER